jgi:signal transduction histidine kinase
MRRAQKYLIRTGAIWLVSLAAVAVVYLFAPSLSNASINMLFRLRGELPPPDEIVIVAIDDASLQQIGRYPWVRGIVAEGLGKISQGNPKVIGLDVIYSEESEPEEDERLAQAIKSSGRVVLPTQLFESQTEDRRIETIWLEPLPEIDAVLAGKGHAHASPAVDGTLRSIQLSKADDAGIRFWAFGLEILRVAGQISADDFEEKSGILRFGSYEIGVLPDQSSKTDVPGVSVIRSNEMLINYAGGTKSFRYFSFADVLQGNVSPETFNGKIVLIGATSPTLGDVQVTPFMHYASGERQGGQAMPGVEVHANIVNTIKNRLWLGFLPDAAGYAIAFLIILASTFTVRHLEGWRLAAILGVILLLVIGGSLLAFNYYYLILPVPEMLTAFLVSVPLLLLDRSLAASKDLDAKLGVLSAAQKGFLLDEKKEFQSENSQNSMLPRNLEWKLRAVDDITGRLLSRMSFINRVLTGMAEGVLASDVSGRIVFVNHQAARFIEAKAEDLIGKNLAEWLLNWKVFEEKELREALEKVLAGEIYKKDFEVASQARHYFLQLSLITAGDSVAANGVASFGGSSLKTDDAIGILILLSDVTEQRELDRLKAETLQLVSHELRAPLTSIQGLSDVLMKFPVSDEQSSEMLETIHSEAVRLNNLINRFLDLKQLESGTLEMRLSPVDINPLIAECIAAASAPAAEKGIFIENKAQSSLPLLQADRQLITQAVGNLLTNALKYSPPNTAVTIEAADADSELQIIVRDQGYGIPEKALRRIFEKFYRLERDTSAGVVGTGLGLAFVKDVAEKHGGRVTVESREGAGSTFTLHLPK